MTPDSEAALRRVATGEDWSPPQREDLTELLGEIDALRTQVTMFQDQRDGVLASVRAHAEPLRRIAGLHLEANPGDDQWGFVQYYALQLLRFAGLPPRTPVNDIQWGIGIGPIGSPDFYVLGDYTERGARHHAPNYDGGHAVYRHLGPWLDAPTIPEGT